MTDREILIDLTLKLLPLVQADLEAEQKKRPDFGEVIAESAAYAQDIISAVDSLEDDDGGPDDDGERVGVEVLPPPVRLRRRA